MDESLWRIDNYRASLKARRTLLAAETIRQLANLLHGYERWLQTAASFTFALPLRGFGRR